MQKLDNNIFVYVMRIFTPKILITTLAPDLTDSVFFLQGIAICCAGSKLIGKGLL
jgi:hypothetical protein